MRRMERAPLGPSKSNLSVEMIRGWGIGHSLPRSWGSSITARRNYPYPYSHGLIALFIITLASRVNQPASPFQIIIRGLSGSRLQHKNLTGAAKPDVG